MYKACINHLPAYLSPAALLKAAPLSAQHLMESLLFLAHSFSLAGCRFLSTIPPFGIPYTPHVRNSLTETTFRSKLKTHFFRSTPYLWILVISRLQYALLIFIRRAISNYSCIVFYSISLYSVVARNFGGGDLGLIIMHLAILGPKCCYFCDKFKMQHFYIQFFPWANGGGLTPEIPLAMPLVLYLVYECNVHCPP